MLGHDPAYTGMVPDRRQTSLPLLQRQKEQNVTRRMKRILGVGGAMILITLLAPPIEWRPTEGVSAASCSVSGVISTDTTWSPATCDPYIVSGSLEVRSGVTLTVEAGTTVRFDKHMGLLVQGTLVARGTAENPITLTSNQGTPARGDWGGIHFTDSSVDATFDGSGAYAGGGVVQYAVIDYAGWLGAALHIEDSSPYVDHNSFTGNSGSFGASSINVNGAAIITNNTITGNSIPGDNVSGDGIWASGGASIINNTITGNGRGIYTNGAPIITNNTITGNRSRSDGGGVYTSGGATITGNTITGNSAGGNGGGIYAGGRATITGNTITDNNANGYSSHGGGIYAKGAATIANNTITRNTGGSDGSGGDGIYTRDGATVTSNSITGNTGAGIWAFGAATVTNNTVTGNSEGIILRQQDSYTPPVRYNNIYGNTSVTTTNSISTNMKNTGPCNEDASNNWWGTTTASEIAAGIWDGADYSGLGLIKYQPFLTGPVDITTPAPNAAPLSKVSDVVRASTDWRPLGLAGQNVRQVVPDRGVPGRIYAHTDGGGYRSDDLGTNWQAITDTLPFLARDPNDAQKVYRVNPVRDSLVWDEFLKSTDGGISWTRVFTTAVIHAVPDTHGNLLSVPPPPPPPAGGSVPSLLSLYTSYSYYHTVGDTRSASWSTDDGKNWRRVDTANLGTVALVVSPVVSTTWAAAANVYQPTYFYVSPPPEVLPPALYRSLNSGSTWTEVCLAPGIIPSAMAADPVQEDSFYLSSEGSVFHLEGTSNWVDLTGNLPSLTVNTLALDYSSPPRLLLGTNNGVWVRRPLYAFPPSLFFFKDPAEIGPSTATIALAPAGGVTSATSWVGAVMPTVSWLSLTPAGNVVLPVTVTLSVDTFGLSPGNYDTTVSFRASGSALTEDTEIPVKLHFGAVSRSYLPVVLVGAIGW